MPSEIIRYLHIYLIIPDSTEMAGSFFSSLRKEVYLRSTMLTNGLNCMLMLVAHKDVDKIELDEIAGVASSKNIPRKCFWDFLRLTMLMILSFCVCVCVRKAFMTMESIYSFP
jgi:hypothetical protein